MMTIRMMVSNFKLTYSSRSVRRRNVRNRVGCSVYKFNTFIERTRPNIDSVTKDYSFTVIK